MRIPRARRPQRTFRWHGVVEEIEGDSLWAKLVPDDHSGPELSAEFARAALPDAQLGTFFTIHAYRKGKKRRTVIRERRLPVWTQDQLDAIQARAKEWAEKVAPLWTQEAS